MRARAGKLLAALAAVEPATVRSASPALRSRLADDDPLVRKRVTWALRDVEATDATADLRAMAADDPDPEARALARETLEALSDDTE